MNKEGRKLLYYFLIFFRELFEERISQVSETIDKYEVAHISTLDYLAVRKALTVLHSQNLILMHATDEEQLVDRYKIQGNI